MTAFADLILTYLVSVFTRHLVVTYLGFCLDGEVSATLKVKVCIRDPQTFASFAFIGLHHY